ncbi:MAG: MFS transporter [Chloroflexi bacterium]|nr:MFS transporter [Chloroflexota bacterium]
MNKPHTGKERDSRQPTKFTPIKPKTGERRAEEGAVSRWTDKRADAVVDTNVVAGRGPGSTLQFQPRPVGLARGLTALSHRDFRLFWISQLISLTGTWMQVLAQGWLVLQIGGTPFDLGVVSALQFLPTLALSIFGGVLADKFPKRYLLLGTQSAAMFLAFALAALSWAGIVNLVHVMILATLLGFSNAVDMPTRQAYVIELVGRRDLPNAITLNAAAFNGARLIGPALGGLAIALVGLDAAFFLNGVSFLPVLAALLLMKAGAEARAEELRPHEVLAHVQEGLSFVQQSRLVLLTILLAGLVATFGMNFNVIAPVFARDVLHAGADGLGALMAAMGVGALTASLLLAFFEWEPHPMVLSAGAVGLGAFEILLSQIATLPVALVLMSAIGFAMIILTTMANITLQTSTPDALRGRVMAVYTTVFVGSVPAGSLFTGALAYVGGAEMPLLIGGTISVGVAVWVWWQVSRPAVV